MAKRKRRKKPRERAGGTVDTTTYEDPEHGRLELRNSLGEGTIAKIGGGPARAASTLEDHWQRREEMLFEHLAVGWEVAGLPLDDQKMLLARYRMASPEERRWVQRVIAGHLEAHLPRIAPGS